MIAIIMLRCTKSMHYICMATISHVSSKIHAFLISWKPSFNVGNTINYNKAKVKKLGYKNDIRAWSWSYLNKVLWLSSPYIPH